MRASSVCSNWRYGLCERSLVAFVALAAGCADVWDFREGSIPSGGVGVAGAHLAGGQGGGGSGGAVAGSGGAGGASCSDGSQNGEETDADCGGTKCDPCELGQACLVPADCVSGSCMGGRCVSCGMVDGWRAPSGAGTVDITANPGGSSSWIVYPQGSAPSVSAAIAVEDSARATSDVAPGCDSRGLGASGFGFALPETAIVTGIELQVRRATSGTVTNHDLTVRLGKEGVGAGGNKADTGSVWPLVSTAFAWKSYGGAADLWETTWSTAEINSAGFGVHLATHNHASGSEPSTAYIDALAIRIHYCN